MASLHKWSTGCNGGNMFWLFVSFFFRLINVAEDYAGTAPLGNDTERLFRSENLVINMLDTKATELHKLNLSANALPGEEPRASVRLPNSLPVSGNQRVQAVTFKKPTLFQEVNTTNASATVRRLNSIVFAVKVGERSLNNLTSPIELDFKLNQVRLLLLEI